MINDTGCYHIIECIGVVAERQHSSLVRKRAPESCFGHPIMAICLGPSDISATVEAMDGNNTMYDIQ